MRREPLTGEKNTQPRLGCRPATRASDTCDAVAFGRPTDGVLDTTRLLEEQRTLVRRLSALNTVAAVLHGGLELGQVIDHVLSCASDVTGMEMCTILLLNDEGDRIDGAFSNVLSKEELDRMALRLENSIFGSVVREQRKVVALSEFLGMVRSPLGRRVGIKSTLMLPLRPKDRSLGILYLSDLHGTREFSPDEIEIATAFADHVAIALENAGLLSSLQASEQKYRELVENANDMIFAIDSTGCFTFCNSRFEQLLHYTMAELVGRPFTDIVTPEFADIAREHFRQALKGFEPNVAYELDIVTKTGCVVNAELSINTIYRDGALVARQGIFRDITEKKRMLQENQRHLRELSALNAIATTVSQSLDLADILNNTLDKVLEVMGIEAGSVYLLDEQEQVVQMMTWRGLSSHIVEREKRKRLGEGFCGAVTLSGVPIVVEDLTRVPGVSSADVRERGFRCLASLPIKSKNKTWGALQLVSRRAREFTPENVQLLTAIAHQIGVAVENASLHAQTVRMQKERIGMLKERLAQVTRAQDQERRRLARELHDEMAQSLINLIVELELYKARLHDHAAWQREVERYQATLREMLASTRCMLSDLRMIPLTTIGLKAALEEDLLPRLHREMTFPIRCEYHAWPEDLPQDVSFNLYRIIQETLLNAKKHAQATEIVLICRADETRLEVQVSDNGVGFALDSFALSSQAGSHLGLVGNRERAALLGGEFIVCSEVGKGTTVLVHVPIDWRAK